MNNLLDDASEFPLEDCRETPAKNIELWKNRFIEEVTRKRASIQTIQTYSVAINTFIKFTEEHPKNRLPTIGAKYINRFLFEYQMNLVNKKPDSWKNKKRYLSKMKKEDLELPGKNGALFTVYPEFENTLSQRQTILKIFLKFITENNKDQHDYTSMFKGMVKIKISEKFTDCLTREELLNVIGFMQEWPENYKKHKKACSLKVAYRDAALILVYALSGGRSDEVVHIKLKDIREDSEKSRYIIKIEKGKGGKKRSVWIEKKYFEKFYLFFKETLPSEDFYISSTYRKEYKNRPMSPGHIRTFGNTVLNILNINKRGLHSFRRGYVTDRITHDKVDIGIVAKEAGNTVAILEKHYLKHDATEK